MNSKVNIDPSTPLSVTGGQITGKFSEDKMISIYQGIPFSAPPIGNLRWKAPQLVVHWEGVKECVAYSTSAIQGEQLPFMCWSKEFIIDTEKGYSEDCLYLNVWTRSESKEEKRPVIVYIHGGANISGGTSCAVYDGEAIAKKGVVYVSINYRLGILGFLAHADLSAESDDRVSGNYAILDQIAALKWVKENIEQFGGDPHNVTIVGQSAGSSNVHKLVISPLADGLFKNAVTMSLNPISGDLGSVLSLEEKEQEGAKLFEGKSLEEMRTMSTEELLKLQAEFRSVVCIDGFVLTGDILDTYKAGLANNVNIMTGMVNGDTALFSILSSGAPPFIRLKEFTKAQFESAVVKQFGELADECFVAYPVPSEDALEVFNQLNIDGVIMYQHYLAKVRMLNSDNKTYIYEFSRVMPGPEADVMGAFHTVDVPYWLNYFSNLRDGYWTETDYSLGDVMSSYLVNFAKSGDPNGDGLVVWTPYEERNISYVELGDHIEDKTLSSDKIKFWTDYLSKSLDRF